MGLVAQNAIAGNMQTAININLCSRCRKQRIVVRTWKEVLVNSTITHTETVCPDLDCQKVVDAQNDATHAKRVSSEENRAKTEEARKLKIRQNLTLGKARG